MNHFLTNLFHPISILFLFFGLFLGSLANVFIYRIPRELPLGLFRGWRSRCPHCEQVIFFSDNVPLLSFLLLKGESRCCKKAISLRYPLVEGLTAILLWVSSSVLLSSPTAPLYQGEWMYVLWFVLELYFAFTLLVIVFIDIDFRIIPDRFTLGSWGIALFMCFTFENYSWLPSVLGGAFGFLSFWLLAWTYERVKGMEGLGFGDVKMMGWLGTWLGFMDVPIVILIGSASGLVVGLIAMKKSTEGMKTAIPFGPFLSLGAFLVWCKIKLFSGL